MTLDSLNTVVRGSPVSDIAYLFPSLQTSPTRWRVLEKRARLQKCVDLKLLKHVFGILARVCFFK